MMFPSVRASAVFALGALMLFGCDRDMPEYSHEMRAFDEPATVTILGLPPEAASEQVVAAVEDIRFVEEASHPWKPGPLGRTNTLLATTGSFSANPSVIPLIELAREMSARTGGLFNPALGELVELWGFHQEIPGNGPPEQDAIRAVLDQSPRMEDIVMEGIRMRSTNPAVQLDFGALAPGYALDTAARTLADGGTPAGHVRIGDDIKVFGAAHPVTLKNTQGIHRLTLEPGEALYRVAAADRSYGTDGDLYHPVIDPRTGRPATGVERVTVVAESAARAGALASALFAAGPTDWVRLTTQLEPITAMLEGTDGQVLVTEELARRLEPVSGNRAGMPKS